MNPSSLYSTPDRMLVTVIGSKKSIKSSDFEENTWKSGRENSDFFILDARERQDTARSRATHGFSLFETEIKIIIEVQSEMQQKKGEKLKIYGNSLASEESIDVVDSEVTDKRIEITRELCLRSTQSMINPSKKNNEKEIKIQSLSKPEW